LLVLGAANHLKCFKELASLCFLSVFVLMEERLPHTNSHDPSSSTCGVPPATCSGLWSQVNYNICYNREKSSCELAHENAALVLELQRLNLESQDNQVDAEWYVEIAHWRREVSRLTDLKETRERLKAEAAETARTRAERERTLASELQSEEMTFQSLEQQIVAASYACASCGAEADATELRNFSLEQKLQRDAALGSAGGGTAHLFVAALPELDSAAIERACEALDARIHQMQAAGHGAS